MTKLIIYREVTTREEVVSKMKLMCKITYSSEVLKCLEH